MKLPRWQGNPVRKDAAPEIVTTRNFDDLGSALASAFVLLEADGAAQDKAIAATSKIAERLRRLIGNLGAGLVVYIDSNGLPATVADLAFDGSNLSLGKTLILAGASSVTPEIQLGANAVANVASIIGAESGGGGTLMLYTKTTGGVVTERARITNTGGAAIGSNAIAGISTAQILSVSGANSTTQEVIRLQTGEPAGAAGSYMYLSTFHRDTGGNGIRGGTIRFTSVDPTVGIRTAKVGIYGSNNEVQTLGVEVGPTGSVTLGGLTSLAGGGYEEGTFTITLTGVTTTVTDTAQYVKIGKVVTLYIPPLTGTSNSTALTLTGMPTVIRPTRSQGVDFSDVVDNTTSELVGAGTIATSGTITITPRVSATAFGSFTAANTKGLGFQTVTYSLA